MSSVSSGQSMYGSSDRIIVPAGMSLKATYPRPDQIVRNLRNKKDRNGVWFDTGTGTSEIGSTRRKMYGRSIHVPGCTVWLQNG